MVIVITNYRIPKVISQGSKIWSSSPFLVSSSGYLHQSLTLYRHLHPSLTSTSNYSSWFCTTGPLSTTETLLSSFTSPTVSSTLPPPFGSWRLSREDVFSCDLVNHRRVSSPDPPGEDLRSRGQEIPDLHPPNPTFDDLPFCQIRTFGPTCHRTPYTSSETPQSTPCFLRTLEKGRGPPTLSSRYLGVTSKKSVSIRFSCTWGNPIRFISKESLV